MAIEVTALRHGSDRGGAGGGCSVCGSLCSPYSQVRRAGPVPMHRGFRGAAR